MSLHLTVTCDGHRNGDRCRGTASQSAGSASRLAADWRHTSDGGDLCPSLGHDEDPPERVLIDPDPRARRVPGIGRVVEPPITGRP